MKYSVNRKLDKDKLLVLFYEYKSLANRLTQRVKIYSLR